MSAPFRSFVPIAIILGFVGAAGLLYVLRIMQRTTKLQTYQSDAEDWTWHIILPFIAYATIVAGAIALHADPSRALFAPAGAVLLLIFVGIHNAWDVVTYLAMRKVDTLPDQPPES